MRSKHIILGLIAVGGVLALGIGGMRGFSPHSVDMLATALTSVTAPGNQRGDETAPASTPMLPPATTPPPAAGGALPELTYSDGDIFLARLDGTAPRQLTHDPASDDFPAWSPDGQQLAFASQRGGKDGIYLMQADGSNLVRIADGTQPAWAPDGHQIAFVSGYAPVESLFVWDQQAGVSTVLQLERAIRAPTWSPDGSYLVVTTIEAGQMVLERVSVAGTTPQPLAPGSHAAWSPNGTHLAFQGMHSQICVINRESIGLLSVANEHRELTTPAAASDGCVWPAVNVTNNRVWNDYPAWSLDGQHIAFVSAPQGGVANQLWMMRADGTRQRPIVTEEGVYSFPTWSPDGQYLAVWYETVASTLDGVQIVQVDGTPVTEIPRAGRPVWRPQR